MEKYAVIQESEKKGPEKTAHDTGDCKHGHGRLEERGNLKYCEIGGSECYEKVKRP